MRCWIILLVFRLTPTVPQVFMKAWARRVLTSDYASGKTWAYMDKVGIMHTGCSPFKSVHTILVQRNMSKTDRDLQTPENNGHQAAECALYVARARRGPYNLC